MFQFKFNLRDVSFNSNMFSGSQKCIGRSVPRVPVPVDHLRVKRRNCEVAHKQKHGFNLINLRTKPLHGITFKIK